MRQGLNLSVPSEPLMATRTGQRHSCCPGVWSSQGHNSLLGSIFQKYRIHRAPASHPRAGRIKPGVGSWLFSPEPLHPTFPTFPTQLGQASASRSGFPFPAQRPVPSLCQANPTHPRCARVLLPLAPAQTTTTGCLL